jgi:hypothetical protein
MSAEIAKLSVPDQVKSPFGDLTFFDGVPLADTVKRGYDALDLIRGIDVFLNCVPGASLVAFRKGLRAIGISSPRVIGYSDPRANSRLLGLTPNTESTYGTTWLDLKAWGPTVIGPLNRKRMETIEKLKKGHKAGDKTYKVHIDGYNLLSFLTTEGVRSPRKGFIYFSDDGDLVGLRFDNWKVVFMEQRLAGTLGVWAEPFVALRLPKLFNLRTDPFERADITSNTCWDWVFTNGILVLAASNIVGEFMKTFKEFPPRQKAASFTIDQALEKMESVASGAGH